MRPSLRMPSGNVVWAGLEAAIGAALSFASAFLVARLAGPGELGIGAAAVSVHVLLWVPVNALFADAIVQVRVLDGPTRDSAVWAGGLAGLLGCLLQLAAAWPLAAALGDARLVPMCLLLALALPFVGLAGPVQGVLTRERRYRDLARRTLIGQGLGTLAGIGLALAGLGAWAVVMQQLVISVAGAAALLLRGGWWPALRPQAGPLRALLRIGLPLTGGTLVQQGRYRLFVLLLGGTAGPEVLGQVHLAFRLVDTVRELAITALWRLMLPVLAERQHDRLALRAAIERFLALSGLALFPVLGAILAVAHPLLALLLGPGWSAAAGAVSVLVLLSAWLVLAFPAGVAMVACGRPQAALFASLGAMVLTAVGVLLLRPETPVAAALVWLAPHLVTAPALLRAASRVLRMPPLRQVAAGLAPLGLAALASLAALCLPALAGEPAAPALRIVLRLAIGAAVYLPAAALLLRGSLREALRSLGLKPA